MHIHDVHDLAGLGAVAGLFGSLWGDEATTHPAPLDVLIALTHAGHQVCAARREGELIGAGLCVTTPDPGLTYSMLLAVAPRHRGEHGAGGVGTALKHHQRAWALGVGASTMRWTFDPLVRHNAWFNLVRVGARVSAYERDFYGEMTDALNAGDRSDRWVVDWDLGAVSPVGAGTGVHTHAGAPPGTEPPIDSQVRDLGPDGLPAVRELGRRVWVRIPRDILEIRRTSTRDTLAWRLTTRAWLGDPVAAGARVLGISRSGWYSLERAA